MCKDYQRKVRYKYVFVGFINFLTIFLEVLRDYLKLFILPKVMMYYFLFYRPSETT